MGRRQLGSKLTMKYPSGVHDGAGAKGEILSIAFAGKGQTPGRGRQVVHVAPHTRSKITSKSISKDGGRASYRGLLKVYKGAEGSQSTSNATRCCSMSAAAPTHTRTSKWTRTKSPSGTRHRQQDR